MAAIPIANVKPVLPAPKQAVFVMNPFAVIAKWKAMKNVMTAIIKIMMAALAVRLMPVMNALHLVKLAPIPQNAVMAYCKVPKNVTKGLVRKRLAAQICV
jgi:hypothetical protein